MGGKQIRPAGVYKSVMHEIQNPLLKGHEKATPPWHNVLRSIPPSENVVRTLPIRHQQANRKSNKLRNLYRPQRISYPEDSLRNIFYKDHPWELARPRIVIETDGKDYQRCDWSKGLRQSGIPLTGECVVQRQLWLMQNENMGRQKAYDLVRREFYRLRQEEEIEKRVALEEARYVGAYFGKSRLEVGLQLENAQYEEWKTWAGKEAERRESLRNDLDDADPEAVDDVVEEAPAVEPVKV